MSITYIDKLKEVAESDVASLKKAQESYGDSWKKRGGVGAFMMLARKWDRLEQQVKKSIPAGKVGNFDSVDAYDIFSHAAVDQRAEGLIDDIRDLRRYLMLVEAELRATGIVVPEVAKDASKAVAGESLLKPAETLSAGPRYEPGPRQARIGEPRGFDPLVDMPHTRAG